MEIIKRNSSLVEYNNCIGDEEVNFVYELNKLDDESWTLYLVDGGISIRVNSENTKGVVQFAPRKKDKTIDIVMEEALSMLYPKYEENDYLTNYLEKQWKL